MNYYYVIELEPKPFTESDISATIEAIHIITSLIITFNHNYWLAT